VRRFLIDPDMPFINTRAGRDTRMMNVQQKISRGFRSRSPDDLGVVRGAISTAKKHEWNILDVKTNDRNRCCLELRR
jgi:transposase